MKAISLFFLFCWFICLNASGQEKLFNGKIAYKTFTSVSTKSPTTQKYSMNGDDVKYAYVRGDSVHICSTATGLHTCYFGNRVVFYSDNLKTGVDIPNFMYLPNRYKSTIAELTVMGEKTFKEYKCQVQRKIDNISTFYGGKIVNSPIEMEYWVSPVPYLIPSIVYESITDPNTNLIGENSHNVQSDLIVRCTLKTFLATNSNSFRNLTGDIGGFISAELEEVTEMRVSDEQLLPPPDYRITRYETLPVSPIMIDNAYGAAYYLLPEASRELFSINDFTNMIKSLMLYMPILQQNTKYLKKKKKYEAPTKKVIVYDIDDDWDF